MSALPCELPDLTVTAGCGIKDGTHVNANLPVPQVAGHRFVQWEVDGVPVTTNPLNLDKVIDGPSVIFPVYEPLPDHPTAAPNSWDAGSDAATTIWTVTNPTTGALLDWLTHLGSRRNSLLVVMTPTALEFSALVSL